MCLLSTSQKCAKQQVEVFPQQCYLQNQTWTRNKWCQDSIWWHSTLDLDGKLIWGLCAGHSYNRCRAHREERWDSVSSGAGGGCHSGEDDQWFKICVVTFKWFSRMDFWISSKLITLHFRHARSTRHLVVCGSTSRTAWVSISNQNLSHVLNNCKKKKVDWVLYCSVSKFSVIKLAYAF